MTQTSTFMHHLLPNVNLVGNPFDLLEQAVTGSAMEVPRGDASALGDGPVDAETCWPC